MISLPVVAANGALRGRLRAENAAGEGTVGEHIDRVEAFVDEEDSLDTALGRSLLTEEGWVAVITGDHFLGTLTPAAIHRALRASLHNS
jgi:osmoprotectant transport system ATP-binding protein